MRQRRGILKEYSSIFSFNVLISGQLFIFAEPFQRLRVFGRVGFISERQAITSDIVMLVDI